MNPAIVILGYSEAAMFLKRNPAPDLVGLISIHGRRECGVEARVPRRLDLTFDDVEVPNPQDVWSLQRALSLKRWDAQNGIERLPPTESDAASIIEFARSARGTEGILLCRCG